MNPEYTEDFLSSLEGPPESEIHQPFFTKKSRETKKIDEREMDVDFVFDFYFNEGVLT